VLCDGGTASRHVAKRGDVKASCRSYEVEALTKGATLRSAQLMAGPELIVKFRCRCGDPAGSRGWVARTDNQNHQLSAPASPGSSPSPRCDANNHTLPQSGRLLYCVQHYAATGGIPEELLILPPGAIQSCHLIRIGLDCQIPLSAAAWRLQSEKQAVRCGLPVIQELCAFRPSRLCQ
jgi:hypothetical protein